MQECAFLDNFEKTRKPTRNTNKKEMASIQQSNGNGVHSRFKQISPELRAEFREKFDEVSRFWGAINDSRQCGRRKKRQDKTRCVLEEVGGDLFSQMSLQKCPIVLEYPISGLHLYCIC